MTRQGPGAELLSRAIERHTGADGAHETRIPQLTLYRLTAPSVPTPLLYEPSLCVIADGRKRVTLGEEAYLYDASSFLLVSTDLALTGEVLRASPRTPYRSLKVALEVSTITDIAASLPRGAASLRSAPRRALSVSALDAPLADAVLRLLGLLDSESDCAVLAPLVLREITYRLLAGEQGARLSQIAAADGNGRRMVRAVRWLKEHFAEPLRVADLAREVSMSPSALHQHFKSVTAMSPLQYQKQLRLHEARRLMLSAGLDASEACFRVGYESPSQFSREYSRLFGAPPKRDVSVTLRALPSRGLTATTA